MTKHFFHSDLFDCFKNLFDIFEKLSQTQILNEVFWFRTNFEIFFSPYKKRDIKLIRHVVMGNTVNK